MKKNIEKIFIIMYIIVNLIISNQINAVEIENIIQEENTNDETENINNQIENTNNEIENTNTEIEPEQQEKPTITEEPGILEEPEQENNQHQEPEQIPETNISTSVETQPTMYYQENYTNNEKSNNNYLQYLKIENVEYEPEFNKYTTEYYLIVDLEVDELEITAVAEDENANVRILGNSELEEGENIITIEVTAEDSSKRNYKIIVTKTDNAELSNANLKSLRVNGFEIYPSFAKNIYKYNLTINEPIKQLEILAEAENQNATIEISGNNELKEGNNIIKITIISENGQIKREYSINTFISANLVEIKKENKLPALIAIIIVSITVFVLLIYILKNKK